MVDKYCMKHVHVYNMANPKLISYEDRQLNILKDICLCDSQKVITDNLEVMSDFHYLAFDVGIKNSIDYGTPLNGKSFEKLKYFLLFMILWCCNKSVVI